MKRERSRLRIHNLGGKQLKETFPPQKEALPFSIILCLQEMLQRLDHSLN